MIIISFLARLSGQPLHYAARQINSEPSIMKRPRNDDRIGYQKKVMWNHITIKQNYEEKSCQLMTVDFISSLVMEYLPVKSLFVFAATCKYFHSDLLPIEIRRRKREVHEIEQKVKDLLQHSDTSPSIHQNIHAAKALCKRARIIVGPPPHLRRNDTEDFDWLHEIRSSCTDFFYFNHDTFSSHNVDAFHSERERMSADLSHKADATLYILPDCFYFSRFGNMPYMPSEHHIEWMKGLAEIIWKSQFHFNEKTVFCRTFEDIQYLYDPKFPLRKFEPPQYDFYCDFLLEVAHMLAKGGKEHLCAFRIAAIAIAKRYPRADAYCFKAEDCFQYVIVHTERILAGEDNLVEGIKS